MTDSEALREKLIDAAIAHVPFDGWGDKALAAAARDLGIDPALVRNAFPGGGIEMIEFHSRLADRRMVADFEHADTTGLKLREKVALAVRLRLSANTAHREAIRRALTILALPLHAALAARLLYRTVDAIWQGLGGKSTDCNFYSQRAVLAGGAMSTLPYWFTANSAE